MNKNKEPYWNRKVVNTGRDASLSHTTLVKQRGLRGTKQLGPANEGRRLSPEEREKIAADMKAKGRL